MVNSKWAVLGKGPGGAEKVAQILNMLPAAEREQVLAEIEEESADTAEEIRRIMFVFNDLFAVSDRDFRTLLQETDYSALAVALRGVSEDMLGKVERNLSARKAEMLRDDMEASPPVRMSEVEAARNKMLRTARKLESEGRIRLKPDPNDVWIE